MLSKRTTLIFSFVMVAAGFLLPLWPLSVGGIVFAAAMGRWVGAILLGLLLDLAYGTPAGFLHYLYLPFTLLAIATSLVRMFASQYVIARNTPDTL